MQMISLTSSDRWSTSCHSLFELIYVSEICDLIHTIIWMSRKYLNFLSVTNQIIPFSLYLLKQQREKISVKCPIQSKVLFIQLIQAVIILSYIKLSFSDSSSLYDLCGSQAFRVTRKTQYLLMFLCPAYADILDKVCGMVNY